MASPRAARDYHHYRRAVRGRRLPLAYCDLDLLDDNAAALAARAGPRPIRVASKSVRCRAVLERVLSRPGFEGVLAYTAGEAAFLARRGIDDVVVAYPTVEPTEVDAACEQVAAGRTITLMVDDAEQLDALAAIAAARTVVLPVCIDLDMSSRYPGLHFGVHRSPIHEPADAVRLARAIAERPSLRLDGLMGYEAQIAGLPDAVPGQPVKNAVARALKRRSLPEVVARRQRVVEALRHDGHALRFVNGGGTGSLEATADDESVTEVTAGSGLYSPALFDGYAGFRHHPAAGFALPITRRPQRGIFTCHGGGYVASGPAGADRLPVPQLPEGARLLPLEGAGEVQTPVRYDGPIALPIGAPIFFRHAKAGELCERFDALHLIAGGEVVDVVPTYRGEGEAFL